MFYQNKNQNHHLATTSHILMGLVVVGNLSLLGVIWFAEDINAALPAGTTRTIAAAPVVETPAAPVVVSPAPAAPPAPTQYPLAQVPPVYNQPAVYEPPLWESYGVLKPAENYSPASPQFLVGM